MRLEGKRFIPGHALHGNGLQRPKRRRGIGQQPKSESSRRPTDKPLVNRPLRSRFPGHALHETDSQGQLGVGTLVSNQERRALVVPLINCRSTAGQCRFCTSIGLHRVSLFRASRGTPTRVVFDRLEGKKGSCHLGEPSRRHPVLPFPAPPRRPAVHRPVPTRPWYVRVLDSAN